MCVMPDTLKREPDAHKAFGLSSGIVQPFALADMKVGGTPADGEILNDTVLTEAIACRKVSGRTTGTRCTARRIPER